jgi:hypothetical protein
LIHRDVPPVDAGEQLARLTSRPKSVIGDYKKRDEPVDREKLVNLSIWIGEWFAGSQFGLELCPQSL